MTKATRNQKAAVARARGRQTQMQSVPAAPAPGIGPAPPGAPPSNTAPANYMDGQTTIFRAGIDSLYISWPGSLFQDMSDRLEAFKCQAQSPDLAERSQATFELLGHRFEVSDKGRGKFAFVLKDNWFDFQISRTSSQSMPLAVAQIKSELLSKSCYQESVLRADTLLSYLGDAEGQKVSRVDLCADFITDFDVAGLPQDGWITRAAAIDTHTVKRKFSGYSIGYGGDIKCRLYDKTLEIEKSNKSYMYELWAANGWLGEHPVWRLEFEFRRSVLRELGIESTADFPDKLNGLWQYGMQDFLRLTVPSASDSLKTRWPEHPLWVALRQARFGQGGLSPLSRTRKERLPSNEFLFVNGLGVLTSFMAQEGISDLSEAITAYVRGAANYHRNRRESGYSLGGYVSRRVSAKIRKFNSRPASTLKDKSADEYRKAKEGE